MHNNEVKLMTQIPLEINLPYQIQIQWTSINFCGFTDIEQKKVKTVDCVMCDDSFSEFTQKTQGFQAESR